MRNSLSWNNPAPFAPSGASLASEEYVPRSRAIERIARRKLLFLNQAQPLEDLKVPPGNRPEAVKGDRKGQPGIRINDLWRFCFAERTEARTARLRTSLEERRCF
jgi:proteic killer suppression protein